MHHSFRFDEPKSPTSRRKGKHAADQTLERDAPDVFTQAARQQKLTLGTMGSICWTELDDVIAKTPVGRTRARHAKTHGIQGKSWE